MISRRTLLASAAATGVALSLPKALWAQDLPQPTIFVDPMIGTGGHGHVYPGASVPFGMIQLSPDTDNARWDACSGYYHADSSLLGFSHTHLSGTGASDMLDLLIVPQVGEIRLKPGTLAAPEGSYRTPMSHDHEVAMPGYYSLTLPATGIRAELTATKRAGLHRYTFPPQADASFLIDWAHGFRSYNGTPTRISEGHIEQVDATTFTGWRKVHQWAGGRIIHFALKLSQPAQAVTFYKDDVAVPCVTALDGTNLKIALHYGPLAAPVLIKASVSAVDINGALGNLSVDLPDFDFDATHKAARDAWDMHLSAIRVDTPNDAHRAIFTTAMYHAHMAPTLFSDSDGRYRGMDMQVHTLTSDQENYSTYSLWDTYRAWHPLMTIIAPERAAIFAQNLITMGMQSPSGPCIWPLQGIETFCMIGWHSAAVIAEALNKGLPGIDAVSAWGLYRTLAFETQSAELNTYRTSGYVPADQFGESVSKTLEYGYDDWAMAHIAKIAGAAEEAEALRQRSRTYVKVFDTDTQFARPRLSNGDWALPFNPSAMGHQSKKWWDFTESNSWQATFLNQHDLYGYIRLFGGDAAFEAKLDALFGADPTLPEDAPPDMTGMMGQYIHGNEPSHHIAYLYAYAGAHDKTQAKVHEILKSQYREAFDGMSGNEDCGQMSAWYILSSLGFYPVDPVTGVYVFGSPLFPRAEIALGDGKTMAIIAENVSDENFYIQSVSLNGKPHHRSWISHAELTAGGTLHFVMGPKPNLSFGKARGERPPSYQSL